MSFTNFDRRNRVNKVAPREQKWKQKNNNQTALGRSELTKAEMEILAELKKASNSLNKLMGLKYLDYIYARFLFENGR